MVVLALSLVQIGVSNSLTTGGIELAQIQTHIQDYQKQNAILKERIYSVASLTHIAQQAEKLGYVSATNAQSTLVIANPQPFALKP